MVRIERADRADPTLAHENRAGYLVKPCSPSELAARVRAATPPTRASVRNERGFGYRMPRPR